MPIYSERQLLLKASKRIIRLLILDGKEGSQEFNEIFTLFVDMESSCYLNPRDPIPQSDGIRRLLQQFPDGTFKQIV
jgi:hypothetical protein